MLLQCYFYFKLYLKESQMTSQNELQRFIQTMSQISPTSPDEALRLYKQKALKGKTDSKDEVAFVDLLKHFQQLSTEYQKLATNGKGSKGQQWDFGKVVGVNQAVIQVQSWWRKVLTLNRLKKDVQFSKEQLTFSKRRVIDTEEALIVEFAKQLKTKGITPESFFRLCDQKYTHQVKLEQFQASLIKLGTGLSQALIKRLLIALDEDMNGYITDDEYFDTLEAYGQLGEQHSVSQELFRKPLEQRCFFKLVSAYRAIRWTAEQFYMACSPTQDQKVSVQNFKKCLEGLKSQLKTKHVHVLCNFMDPSKTGFISRSDFIRLLNKGEQFTHGMQIASSRISETPKIQSLDASLIEPAENNFFDAQMAETGDQAMGGDFPNIDSPLAQSSNKLISDQDQRRNALLIQMEREGSNIQDLLAGLQPFVQNGIISLGTLLRTLQTEYPSLTTGDRNFLINDAIADKTKVNFNQLQNLLKTVEPPKQVQQPVKPQTQSAAASPPWLIKLATALKNQKVTPSQAFKVADREGKGAITSGQLKESIKKLVPDEELSVVDIKKIMMSIDRNKNGLIEESEFIDMVQSTIDSLPNNQKGAPEIKLKPALQQPPQKQVEESKKIPDKFSTMQPVSILTSKVVGQAPTAYTEAVDMIEGKIGMPVQEGLSEFYGQDSVTSLGIQKKMQSLSSGTLERKYVAQLCRVLDKDGNGQISTKEIIQTFMEVGKDLTDQTIEAVKGLPKASLDSLIKVLSQKAKITAVEFSDILESFKVTKYSSYSLFYKLSNFQDELQTKVLLDLVTPKQLPKAAAIIEKSLPSSSSAPLGDVKAALKAESGDEVLVKEVFKYFVENYQRLSQDNCIASSLSKCSSELKKCKSQIEAVRLFDPTGQGLISVGTVKSVIEHQYTSINEDEQVIMAILSITLGKDDITKVDIKVFISFLRSYQPDPKVVAQNKLVLSLKLDQVKKYLTPQTKAQSLVQKVQDLKSKVQIVRSDTMKEKRIHEKELKIERVLALVKTALAKKGGRDKFEKLLTSNPQQSVYFYKLYQLMDQLVGPIKTKSEEDEAKLVQEYLQFEQLMDPDMCGKVSLEDFSKFSENFHLEFKTEVKFVVEESSSEECDSDVSDEEIPHECELLHYKIVPERDYYNGIPSILNSEKAALVVAEHLFKKLGKNEHFLDKDFGPKTEDSSKDPEGSYNSMYFTDKEKLSKKGFVHPDEVEWIRPEHLGLKEDDNDNDHGHEELPFGFVLGGTSSNDVKQGRMGNCWFIGALSVLATRDDLLRGEIATLEHDELNNTFKVDEEVATTFSTGVYPPLFHTYRHKRLYVMRFFCDFKWRYVIIDDRIPCLQGSKKPFFASCTDLHELWVPLIEKAYAKLNGCYEATASGFLDDGLNELTGLVTEKIQLQGVDPRTKEVVFPHKSLGDKEKFWRYLMRLHSQESMMGCSVAGGTENHLKGDDGRPIGILSGHAYGIIDFIELKDPNMSKERKTHRLLRIRNPWGTMEWNGKWGDNSEEILDKYKNLLENYMKSIKDVDERWKLTDDDGTFLMNYTEWRKIYNRMCVCLDFPSNWTAIRYAAEWNSTCSGGVPTKMTVENKQKWAKNPQYLITAYKDMEIFISLAQPNGRGRKNDKGEYLVYPFNEIHRVIHLSVLALPKGKSKFEAFDEKLVKATSPLMQGKDVSVRLFLPEGKYIVVPATQEEGQYGPFFLSFYYNLIMKDAWIQRVDQPDKDEFTYILEETDHFEAVKDWKIDLARKRYKDVVKSKDDLEAENMASFIHQLETL